MSIVVLTRHGHATGPATVESLYRSTRVPFAMVYADIGAPPSVSGWLRNQARQHPDFLYLNFGISRTRQSARREALAHVKSPFVVFVDNNILFADGWLESLLSCQEETGAEVVSPVIVTQGGDLHFSAGLIKRQEAEGLWRRRAVSRPHQQDGIGRAQNRTEVELKRIEIDFAESHCCLVRTDDMKIPGVLDERMGNAQTVAYATHFLKVRHGRKLILEPSATTSIVPIGFGYDLPWVLGNYMSFQRLKTSYRRFERLIGRGPGTDVNIALEWHADHLRHLVLSMTQNDRLVRDDFLRIEDVPDYIRGYDHSLPSDADDSIQNVIVPYVSHHYPELMGGLRFWLAAKAPHVSRFERLWGRAL